MQHKAYWCMCFDLNGTRIKIEVAGSFGNMHAEDFLYWDSFGDLYFEWKPLSEGKKKMIGTRCLEQHSD